MVRAACAPSGVPGRRTWCARCPPTHQGEQGAFHFYYFLEEGRCFCLNLLVQNRHRGGGGGGGDGGCKTAPFAPPSVRAAHSDGRLSACHICSYFALFCRQPAPRGVPRRYRRRARAARYMPCMSRRRTGVDVLRARGLPAAPRAAPSAVIGRRATAALAAVRHQTCLLCLSSSRLLAMYLAPAVLPPTYTTACQHLL